MSALPVATVVQTCYACPAQWEMALADNRYVYARYRWGRLTVTVSESEAAHWASDTNCETLLSKTVDESGWDGVMSNEELRGHLAGILDFTNAVQLTED